jgi:cytochrome c2
MMRAALIALALSVVLVAGIRTFGHRGQHDPIAGADAGRGRAALVEFGCGTCHTIPGVTTAHGRVGPSLAGFSAHAYVAGRLPNNPDAVVRWIRFPQEIEPGNAMPDLGVPELAARDIIAYLYRLGDHERAAR